MIPWKMHVTREFLFVLIDHKSFNLLFVAVPERENHEA